MSEFDARLTLDCQVSVWPHVCVSVLHVCVFVQQLLNKFLQQINII